MQNKSQDGYYSLRSGRTIYPSQDQAMSEVVEKVIKKVPARFALLTDVTGQVILAQGQQEEFNLVALGSLMAGDLAASQEIARLTGEYQDQQLILREGQETHTFILEAGRYLVFLVQVSNDVPLGWARMIIKNGARRLTEILSTQPEEEVMAGPDTESENMLKEADLTDLFDDALDELWME